MKTLLNMILQRSNSSTFRRSFWLILVVEAVTIVTGWLLLDSNILRWIQGKSTQVVRMSQQAAESEDWSLIGTVPRDKNSPLFKHYFAAVRDLSREYFPHNDGDIYVLVVKHGEGYLIDQNDPYPMDDNGPPNRWELAAYSSGKTTYNTVPFSDQNGTYIAAQTPIFRDGKVVGLVGAEYDSATLSDLQDIVKRAFWLSILPAIVVALVVAYLLASMFVEPMEIFRRIDETAGAQRRRSMAAGDPLDHLSAREREVAELVRRGLKNKEIAERLVVTPETVKQHLKNIKDKTGFTRVDLAVHAEASRLSGVREAPAPA